MARRGRLIQAVGISLGFWVNLGGIAGMATPLPPLQLSKTIRECPTDIVTLMDWLIKDLPSYGNRVIQRSQLSQPPQTYIILAGKPEFEPLPLVNRQFSPAVSDRDPPAQIFLTTLERHYISRRAVNFQSYYWIFLTRTSEGWGLVRVVTQLISLERGDPPLPPQDATEGIVGQAIQTWLRDCRTGSLLVQRDRPQG